MHQQCSPDRYQALPDTSWVHAFVNLMSGELYRRMSLPQAAVTLYLACRTAAVEGGVLVTCAGTCWHGQQHTSFACRLHLPSSTGSGGG